MSKDKTTNEDAEVVEPTKEVAVADAGWQVLFGDKNAPVPAHINQEYTRGNENVTAEDQAIPTIKLVQAINVQDIKALTQGKAEVGDLFDTLFNQLHKELFIVNIAFVKTFTIWKARKMGGGKVGEFSTEAEARDAIGALPQMPSDMPYEITQTHKHLCLMLDVNAEEKKVTIAHPCQFYFKKTGIKVSINWNTDIMTRGGDRFDSVWRVSSKDEKSSSGDVYKNHSIEFAGWVPEAIKKEAEAIYESLTQPVSEPSEEAVA